VTNSQRPGGFRRRIWPGARWAMALDFVASRWFTPPPSRADREERRGGRSSEAHLPTEEDPAQSSPRLPQADERQGWARGHQATPSQGPQAAGRPGCAEVGGCATAPRGTPQGGPGASTQRIRAAATNRAQDHARELAGALDHERRSHSATRNHREPKSGWGGGSQSGETVDQGMVPQDANEAGAGSGARGGGAAWRGRGRTRRRHARSGSAGAGACSGVVS